MDPVQSPSVLRYFLPADRFVRIRVCDALALASAHASHSLDLDRSSYRRAVIRACCPDLGVDTARVIASLCPHDPPAGEDLLYQLCIEVNPELDIHTVRLPVAGSRLRSASARSRTARAADGARASSTGLAGAVRGLEARLSARVIGQDAAVRTVVRALERAAAGLAEPKQPLASFLFLGRTGTGKTELARTLARELYGDEPGRLHRVDCSEYGLGHEYSKLIGAPPGFVGHEQGGSLTEAVRRQPCSVVLFDEIEKAHPRLTNLLLQVLDEGQLCDGRGRRVDFSRTLVVLTSNVGATELRDATRRVGFAHGEGLSQRQLGEITSRALDAQFSPEFLGRIGERVLFRELDEGDARAIAGVLLADLAQRVRARGPAVAFAPSVARWIAERGYSRESGARELVHVIRRELETRIADLVLGGRASRGRLVRVSIRSGSPRLAVER